MNSPRRSPPSSPQSSSDSSQDSMPQLDPMAIMTMMYAVIMAMFSLQLQLLQQHHQQIIDPTIIRRLAFDLEELQCEQRPPHRKVKIH